MKDMKLTATEVQAELEKTVSAIVASKQELARLEADEPPDGKGLTLYVQTEARVALLMKKHKRLEGELAQAQLAELKTVEEQADAERNEADEAARRVKGVVEKEVRKNYEPHLGVTFDDIVSSHRRVIKSQDRARVAQGRFIQSHRAVMNFYREHPSME
mgnify:CR=1 FL=1|jgi:hypothetical protein